MKGEPGRNEPCPCGSGMKYKKCCLGEARLPPSSNLARRLTLDLANQEMSVEFVDGNIESHPGRQLAAAEWEPISRVSFNVPARELDFTLPGDQIVTTEIGAGGASDLPPGDRPIVYLDQLHWITLARHEWVPDKLTPDELAAASELIELARDKRIILPLSAAHFTETVPNDGRHRRHLAGTMLELSRGWIMRNPVRVRHEEIKAALEGSDPTASGVFTLQPWEIFTDNLRRTTPTEGAMPGWEDLFPRLTAISAIYATLIEDEKVDTSAGRQKADRWAAFHQRLALQLRDGQASRAQVENAARVQLLNDLKTEIDKAALQSGLQPEAFSGWLEAPARQTIPAMPYLGRLEQLLLHRLRNADEKWNRNDLNDMHFLACGAGYADIVVGEKKMTSYLDRADKALGSRAFVCRTLPDAVARLTTEPTGIGALGPADRRDRVANV